MLMLSSSLLGAHFNNKIVTCGCGVCTTSVVEEVLFPFPNNPSSSRNYSLSITTLRVEMKTMVGNVVFYFNLGVLFGFHNGGWKNKGLKFCHLIAKKKIFYCD
jgi:hypothetical protein